MLQQVRRGWAIATAAWAVLAGHPKLLLFPLAATLFIAATVVAMLQCALALDAALGLWEPLFLTFVWLPLAALGCYFVILGLDFCNAALISCALRAFDGTPPSILAGLAAAGRRLPQVALRSLSGMTIGFLVKAGHRPSNNVDILAFILTLILSGAVGNRYFPWIAGDFFVLPLLVDAQLPLAEARKRSAVLVRLHWGEKADPASRFGYLAAVLAAAAALFAGIAFVLLTLVRVLFGVMDVTALCAVLAALALVLFAGGPIFSALGAIFKAAVYRHALGGTAPAGFSDELLRSAMDRDSI